MRIALVILVLGMTAVTASSVVHAYRKQENTAYYRDRAHRCEFANPEPYTGPVDGDG